MHIISSLSSPVPDIILRLGICWHCQGHPRTGKKIQIKNPVVLRFKRVQTVMHSMTKKQKKRYYTASPAEPGIAVTTITEKKRSSG
jgi:hypothetical protein